MVLGPASFDGLNMDSMGLWIFRYPESNREVHVSWVDVVDVNAALGEYRSMASRVPDREQAAVLTYAEAT